MIDNNRKQTESKDKNILILYLIIIFSVSFILSLGLWNKSEFHKIFSNIIYFIPGLTVIGLYAFKLKKSVFKSGVLGLSLKGFKYWILAPIFITFLCFLGFGVSVLLNPELIKSKDEIIFALEESGFYFGHIGLGLPVILLINTFLGSLVYIPIYLGQELGWRAFMQPQLLKRFNPIIAFIFSGIIWGLWNFFFLGQVYDYSSSPIIESILIILFCIPLGIILQYFYNKSRSIFVSVLAYASVFMSIETAAIILRINEMNTEIYGPMGITGIIIFWIAALFLFKSQLTK